MTNANALPIRRTLEAAGVELRRSLGQRSFKPLGGHFPLTNIGALGNLIPVYALHRRQV
jgi:hypothetical protein